MSKRVRSKLQSRSLALFPYVLCSRVGVAHINAHDLHAALHDKQSHRIALIACQLRHQTVKVALHQIVILAVQNGGERLEEERREQQAEKNELN